MKKWQSVQDFLALISIILMGMSVLFQITAFESRHHILLCSLVIFVLVIILGIDSYLKPPRKVIWSHAGLLIVWSLNLILSGIKLFI